MSDLNENLDQTAFGESAPLMDENGGTHIPKKEAPVAPEAKAEAKSKIKKPVPLPILGAIVTAVILTLVAVLMLLPRTKNGAPLTDPGASPAPVVAALPTELQKAIDTLAEVVTEADPTKNNLPFPPVNFELHLRQPTSSN